MVSLDLLSQSWQLRGWRPFAWQMRSSMEIGFDFHSDITPVPAILPGSAYTALRAAGWLKDWNVGLNSLDCEWVEHRHWEFSTELPAGALPPGQPVLLKADGLDYSGWILIDGRPVATFSGALLRHRIDLTAPLADGQAHQLSLVFDAPPPEQGQIGFTSRSRYFKPRYNYSWDWCPRLVPVGIWDALTLEIGHRPAEILKLSAQLEADLSTGRITLHALSHQDSLPIRSRLCREGREISLSEHYLIPGENILTISIPDVEPWWPNGAGPQPLYDLTLEHDGQVLGAARLGFKHIRWLPCEDAPADALSWICEVNGRPLFLQGVNWTPIKLDYHAITPEEYRQRIALYRDMGCNILRVWGGGFLERQVFFDLCDEAGLLVWQEFPLSSSGIDNWPPEDASAIETLTTIARDYLRRRGHHACKLLWCGGNELQHAPGQKIGIGQPTTTAHPCLAALERVVREEDPGTRFLPNSSSGPRFCAAAEDFGKGLHHDVHGPWNLDSDLEAWKRYWSQDDALFRSETGLPGASPRDIFERYAGAYAPWPPTAENPYWLHTGAWWLQWERFRSLLEGLSAEEGLSQYITLSQHLQAEALAIAARACRQRFPRCGGFLLWMGHDAFPCAANTAIIDFEARPKPAYFALREVFQE